MSAFTDKEIAYLRGQRLGRLATVGRNGQPHVVPVGFRYNHEFDTVDIGGHDFAKRKKWRDVKSNPKVAFVVDDVESLPAPLMRVMFVLFRLANRFFGERMRRQQQRRAGAGGRNPMWTPRGVEVRGDVEVLRSGGRAVNAFFDKELFRIHPTKVVSWRVNGLAVIRGGASDRTRTGTGPGPDRNSPS